MTMPNIGVEVNGSLTRNFIQFEVVIKYYDGTVQRMDFTMTTTAEMTKCFDKAVVDSKLDPKVFHEVVW